MNKLKILAVLVNYGTEQLKYLKKVVDQFHLHFPKYDVTIIINSNQFIDYPELRGYDFIDKHILGNYQLLPLTCRKTIWEKRNDYDIFIYGENDHHMKQIHVDKFLEYNKILPKDRITGLMQYEENASGKWFPAYHARYDWDVNSVEVHGGKKFAHFTNIHQATFMLTQDQLLRIGEMHDFTKFMGTSHYSAKCKVNTDIYQFCGMKKLICIDELEQNMIHHLPNIYINGDSGRLKLGSGEERMNDKINELLKQ